MRKFVLFEMNISRNKVQEIEYNYKFPITDHLKQKYNEF